MFIINLQMKIFQENKVYIGIYNVCKQKQERSFVYKMMKCELCISFIC